MIGSDPRIQITARLLRLDLGKPATCNSSWRRILTLHSVVLDGGWRCGTVPTGPENDPDSVIDQKCKVRYTDNLCVVDASVFPIIPSAAPISDGR
jgi:hypothetical protein